MSLFGLFLAIFGVDVGFKCFIEFTLLFHLVFLPIDRKTDYSSRPTILVPKDSCQVSCVHIIHYKHLHKLISQIKQISLPQNRDLDILHSQNLFKSFPNLTV